MTTAMLDDWLDATRSKVNAEQFRLIALVADRVKVELGLTHASEALREDGGEPMRYLLHGPPGTGKSHAVKYVQELFTLVGYKKGIDYICVAFQATNAADLDGDTIHHAAGIGININNMAKEIKPDAAKRMAYWRWVIIDEISLVPANLLASLEQRLRQAKPSADAWKHASPNNEVRPFAGVNVVALGDFNQLPPPQGGNLADIPHQLRVGPRDFTKAPDAMADAGKQLMWKDVQGVVELTERKRCKDEWRNEVTDELRAGNLSDKNWRYLHGYPVDGCQLSAEEKASRCRVITGPEDPRLQEDKFQEAPVIVANNDSKYQINKVRAKKYARDSGAKLRWSIAKDQASSEALRAESCDKDRKIKSLGYPLTSLFGFGAAAFNLSCPGALLCMLPLSL